MGKQDEEERVKSGRLTLTLLICKTILMMLVRGLVKSSTETIQS